MVGGCRGEENKYLNGSMQKQVNKVPVINFLDENVHSTKAWRALDDDDDFTAR